MYEDTEKFIDLDFEQQVRQTAYHLWESDGRPDGRETEYWFRALEQLLPRRRARSPMGDHNRRVALGMDVDDFAVEARVGADALRRYEATGPHQDFDLHTAELVGAALDRLEAHPPATQKVIN